MVRTTPPLLTAPTAPSTEKTLRECFDRALTAAGHPGYVHWRSLVLIIIQLLKVAFVAIGGINLDFTSPMSLNLYGRRVTLPASPGLTHLPQHTTRIRIGVIGFFLLSAIEFIFNFVFNRRVLAGRAGHTLRARWSASDAAMHLTLSVGGRRAEAALMATAMFDSRAVINETYVEGVMAKMITNVQEHTKTD